MRRVHQAYLGDGVDTFKYEGLVETINAYGEKQADRMVEKWDREMGDWDQKQYEVRTWAYGPRIYISVHDRDGEQKDEMPTIGKGLTNAVMAAGYVPFGFRPDMESVEGGGREPTGRVQWYLRPIDELDEAYETKYGLTDEDGKFVRNDDGDSILFEDEQNARAFADDDLTVQEVWE